MNVNDFYKNISSYLDGDLRPSEMKNFEELLNNNPECKEKFESYKKMLDDLSNLEILKTSDDFLNKLHKRILPNLTNSSSYTNPKTLEDYFKISKKNIDTINSKTPLEDLLTEKASILV